MFNPDSELNSLIRLDDYKQQRSGGYSTAPFSTQYRPEVEVIKGFRYPLYSTSRIRSTMDSLSM